MENIHLWQNSEKQTSSNAKITVEEDLHSPEILNLIKNSGKELKLLKGTRFPARIAYQF